MDARERSLRDDFLWHLANVLAEIAEAAMESYRLNAECEPDLGVFEYIRPVHASWDVEEGATILTGVRMAEKGAPDHA